jgi:transcription elongation GreA/GreB family factor
MASELIILDADRQWAMARITELDEAIQALGPEFYDVFNQSSETWHDNAPFDALRDRQSLLDAERQQLRRVLRESMPSVPKQPRGKAGIGSIVTLRNKKGVEHMYKIAGDWTPHAGQRQGGMVVISAQSPLANQLLGRRPGDVTDFGTIVTVVAE